MPWNKIKLVTFDATNTLLRFRQSPGLQYLQAAQNILPFDSNAHKCSESEINTRFRHEYAAMWRLHPNFGKSSSVPWEEWWRRVVRGTFSAFVHDAEQHVDRIAEQLISDYGTASCWRVAAGGDDLLCQLRAVRPSLTLGVLSNFDPRLEEILLSVGLRDHFDFVLTSYDAGFSKPDERIFKEAISRSGQKNLAPSNALHIGDNVQLDYSGARAAGWHALLLNPKMTDNIINIQSNHIFKDFNSLKNAIFNNTVTL